MWVISSMPWGNMGEASATGEGAVKQAWWPTHLMRGAGPLEREGSIIQREVAKEGEKEAISTGGSGWHVFKVDNTVFKRMEASRKTAHRSEVISEHQHISAVCGCQTCPKRPCWCASIYLAQLHCIKMCHAFVPRSAHFGHIWLQAELEPGSTADTSRWTTYFWKDGDSLRAPSNQLLQVPPTF